MKKVFFNFCLFLVFNNMGLSQVPLELKNTFWLRTNSLKGNAWKTTIPPDAIEFTDSLLVFHFFHMNMETKYQITENNVITSNHSTNLRYTLVNDTVVKILSGDSEFNFFKISGLHILGKIDISYLFGTFSVEKSDSLILTFTEDKDQNSNRFGLYYELLGNVNRGTWFVKIINDLVLLEINLSPVSHRWFIVENANNEVIDCFYRDQSGRLITTTLFRTPVKKK